MEDNLRAHIYALAATNGWAVKRTWSWALGTTYEVDQGHRHVYVRTHRWLVDVLGIGHIPPPVQTRAMLERWLLS